MLSTDGRRYWLGTFNKPHRDWAMHVRESMATAGEWSWLGTCRGEKDLLHWLLPLCTVCSRIKAQGSHKIQGLSSVHRDATTVCQCHYPYTNNNCTADSKLCDYETQDGHWSVTKQTSQIYRISAMGLILCDVTSSPKWLQPAWIITGERRQITRHNNYTNCQSTNHKCSLKILTNHLHDVQQLLKQQLNGNRK